MNTNKPIAPSLLKNNKMTIVLSLNDVEEIEIWKKLMYTGEGISSNTFVCPNCGKLHERRDIIPIIVAPKKPKNELVPMNICVASCPTCDFPLHKECATYGYPFISIENYVREFKE